MNRKTNNIPDFNHEDTRRQLFNSKFKGGKKTKKLRKWSYISGKSWKSRTLLNGQCKLQPSRPLCRNNWLLVSHAASQSSFLVLHIHTYLWLRCKSTVGTSALLHVRGSWRKEVRQSGAWLTFPTTFMMGEAEAQCVKKCQCCLIIDYSFSLILYNPNRKRSWASW